MSLELFPAFSAYLPVANSRSVWYRIALTLAPRTNGWADFPSPLSALRIFTARLRHCAATRGADVPISSASASQAMYSALNAETDAVEIFVPLSEGLPSSSPRCPWNCSRRILISAQLSGRIQFPSASIFSRHMAAVVSSNCFTRGARYSTSPQKTTKSLR